MNNYNTRNNIYAQQYYDYDIRYDSRGRTYARKCALYSKGNARSYSSSFVSVMRFLYLIYKLLEKVFATDEFAAAFIGVSLVLIVGVAGGVQFGVLSLSSGVLFSGILLSVVSLFIYKKNRE